MGDIFSSLSRMHGVNMIKLSIITHTRPALHCYIFASRVWNSLPVSIRDSQSLPTFRRHLQTFYFQSAYPISAAFQRLLYASPAWLGFARTQDRQKVQGFLCHSVRVGFCSPDLSSFNELSTQADQNMFSKVSNNTDHVLHHLLTPVHNTSHSY